MTKELLLYLIVCYFISCFVVFLKVLTKAR